MFLLTLIFTLVAASISPFLTAAIKFSCFYSNEIDIFSFISRSSSFSVIHVNIDVRIKSKERIEMFLISKRSGGYAIYRRNARVVEMQNFTLACIKGWMYVRTHR